MFFVFVAWAAGIYGVKRGIDASADNARAARLNADALGLLTAADARLDEARSTAIQELGWLHELKVGVRNDHLDRFVGLLRRVHPVSMFVTLEPDVAQLLAVHPELAASQAPGATALAIGPQSPLALQAGAVAALTSAGFLTAFGAAPAEIAAAEAAGGVAAASGFAVVSLIVGPALAVGGSVMAAEAERRLADARMSFAESQRAADERLTAATMLDGITVLSRQSATYLSQLVERFTPMVEWLAAAITRCNGDYARLTDAERRYVHVCVTTARTIKAMLEAPLVTPDGQPADEFHLALAGAQDTLGYLP